MSELAMITLSDVAINDTLPRLPHSMGLSANRGSQSPIDKVFA